MNEDDLRVHYYDFLAFLRRTFLYYASLSCSLDQLFNSDVLGHNLSVVSGLLGRLKLNIVFLHYNRLCCLVFCLQPKSFQLYLLLMQFFFYLLLGLFLFFDLLLLDKLHPLLFLLYRKLDLNLFLFNLLGYLVFHPFLFHFLGNFLLLDLPNLGLHLFLLFFLLCNLNLFDFLLLGKFKLHLFDHLLLNHSSEGILHRIARSFETFETGFVLG